MNVLYLILYLLAAICFLAYAFNVRAPRVQLLGLGVFFWALVPLLETIHRL